ncbi:hypothetical protein Tco_1023477, partial [Tanacetum coccineum]
DENRSFTKSVNNEAPVINAEPISVMHPSDIIKNVMDSRNTSSEEDGLSPIGPDAPSYLEVGKRSMVAGKRKVVVGSHGEDPHRKAQKVLAQASKVAGDASTPLDVDSDPDIHGKPDPSTVCEFPSAKELKDATDCHWVFAHVTPPSWKQYLREISTEHLSRASCDTIREREIKKDKAYAELEKKCNESLQNLDKNPLVSDMRTKIETLQSRLMVSTVSIVGSYLKRRSRLNMSTTLSTSFRAKVGRAIRSEGIDSGFLREIQALQKEMSGYHPSSKKEYDRAGNDLADATFPFLVGLTADPHASVEQLLAKKPQSLQSKCLSSKAS